MHSYFVQNLFGIGDWKDLSCIYLHTGNPGQRGPSIYATRAFATPFFVAYATPLFVSSATPFFRSFATQTFATPKNLSLILEALVDKEVAKLVEEVNEELVMDVVVEGVVDNR